MVQIKILNNFLTQYESKINIVIDYFTENFGVKNPTKKWRNGLINRTGFLDKEMQVAYSFHGAGCTAEFNSGEIVSFDFDEVDEYSFDVFKFKLFLESNPEFNDYISSLDDTIDQIEIIRINNNFEVIYSQSGARE